MSQKLGRHALAKVCYLAFYRSGPACSARGETPLASLHPEIGAPLFNSLGLDSSNILPMACCLSPSPSTSVPCSCLLQGPACRREAGMFVMPSLANQSGQLCGNKATKLLLFETSPAGPPTQLLNPAPATWC